MTTSPTPDDLDLLEHARAAAQAAYVPYSRFAVGAALRLADGSVVSGANVENASFGLTICAERVAACSAVAAGKREFSAIAVHVDGDDGQPCGACRQFLAEFAPGLRVVYRSGGEVRVGGLDGMLADAFLPEVLR